ncbi:MAG: hypothetical protein GC185_08285 [Alphaproteobacteria bacterium]|nr:hypothetical protein [Alphaproteobacteria bacterium]
MTAARIENTVIHLLGFPGTGKYTVAKEISARAGLHLVDNHLVNHPVFSIIHADGKTPLPPRVWDNVGMIWDAVIDTIEHISPREYGFVMTNALMDDDAEDREHALNIARMMDRRGGTYVPVRLILSDVEEHVRRITAENRKARRKETNPEAPARYTARKVLEPGLPHVLTLDVTALQPAEAAAQILDHVHEIAKNA